MNFFGGSRQGSLCQNIWVVQARRATMHTTSIMIAFSIVIPTIFNAIDARSSWLCIPCHSSEDCNREPPMYCPWGENRDACNRRVCAKGPGERCGGPMGIYGYCADGMMCKSDERCYGCTDNTLDCSS